MTKQRAKRPPYKLPEALAEKWVTQSDACDLLGISRWTLQRRIDEGQLESSSYNAIRIVSRASIARYLKQWI